MLKRTGLLLLLATAAFAQRTLFRSPAVNKTQIVFAYAGDLWTVPRAGGAAVQLTSGAGQESSPVFSPDGTMVAFTGQYDGSTDVFVVPAAGGVPKRLTFHPGADLAHSWTPDGKRVVFTNLGTSHNNAPQLYTVDLNGSFPEKLPLPQGTMGAYSPDGSQLVYSPVLRADAYWKNYRGGRATPLWIARLSDSSITKIPRTDSNDHSPMWIGGKIYFLSDRTGRYGLWEYDLASKRVNALIESKTLDIKSASASSDVIAYEQFGEIHLFDLKSRKDSKVEITLNGDLSGVRPRLEKTARNIRTFNLSPTGARALFEARGDVYTVPAEKGDIRNLTQSSGEGDRDPSWSPDGKWIAYFSDGSGEYQLCLRDQTGRGEVTRIPLATSESAPTFFYSITWSPDSKKIAYADKKLQLWYLDLDKKQPVLVDRNTYSGSQLGLRPRWAPDSEWIGYNKQLKSGVGAVFVYSLKDAKPTQITDGLSDAGDMDWDRNGKYLYFLASNDSGPGQLGLDLSSVNRPQTASIWLTVLTKSDPSPLAPESDEEKVADEKGDAKADGKKDDSQASPKDPAAGKNKLEVKIDFEGIAQRMIPLPLPVRNYGNLTAGKTGILFYQEFPVIPAAANGPGAVTLHRFDLSKRKSEVFLAGATGFRLSANGEKILLAQTGERFTIASSAAPPKPGEGLLKLEGMETIVDPVAEWRQIYREVWRIERDFFYDANFHGLDIQAASERYEQYLKAVAHRGDLNYLFGEMLGQLSVGHLYINGGDLGEDPKTVRVGLLGADYQLENGRYRFARVYNGENWNPQTRAPLSQPGVSVQAGEYLLAINGRDLRDTDNVYQAMAATAGKSVVLKVGPNASGEGSRDVTVVPVEEEFGLRTLAWVEDNRRKVGELSGGKLAYIHLPDTAGGGYSYFNRYYFAQTDKQGAIIDERFNRGGLAADYVIDHLRRPVWNYWKSRDGEISSTPGKIIVGPKVMIANENSGSGGDLLPWLFKRAKLGPVVGKRTWGGLVGIGGYPPLIDGGTVTAPHFGFYTPESKWEVENHGTEPDVEVDLDPQAWRQGRDTQLEKAVELAMAELKKAPPSQAPAPAFPDYHKGGPLGSAKR